MDPLYLDWLSLFVRWAHLLLGIMWIGTSFHFIWLDASLRRLAETPKGVAGESWMVHGGGFYRVEKFVVAPAVLPRELHWFKYEAYFNWLTGILLLVVVYYVDARAFLIDPSVAALEPRLAILISAASLVAGWLAYDIICRSPLGNRTAPLALIVFLLAVGAAAFYGQLFSGRAAFVHVGAFLGTMMAANVFFIIIPNQKKAVADLIAGRAPDPALGRQAKQRSLHNNYLTLPVVLMMLSTHYPMLYDRGFGWLMVALVIIMAWFGRHHENLKAAGRHGDAIDWLLVGGLATAIVMIVLSLTLHRDEASAAGGAPVTLAEVMPVIQQRCQSCHSANPSDSHYPSAPKGVALDSPEQVEQYAAQIWRVTVRSNAMPLGNKTGMQAEERALLARWLAGLD